MKAYNPIVAAEEARMNVRNVKIIMAAAFLALLLPDVAMAQQSEFNFPVLDTILCGFISYSKTKLAPMIAVIVIIFSVVGHWLGSSKMWTTMLYVGLGIGIIMGIGSLIANTSGVGTGCLG